MVLSNKRKINKKGLKSKLTKKKRNVVRKTRKYVRKIKGGGFILSDIECNYFKDGDEEDQIRSNGDCFFDSVYQSAKYEGILALLVDKVDIKKNDFSKYMREQIGIIISQDADFNKVYNENLSNEEYKKNLKEMGINKNDSYGYSLITNKSFNEYINIIKNTSLYVTEIEIKAFITYINRRLLTKSQYNDNDIKFYSIFSNFIKQTKIDICNNYNPGKLNIFKAQDNHYGAIKNSSEFKTQSDYQTALQLQINSKTFYNSIRASGAIRESRELGR